LAEFGIFPKIKEEKKEKGGSLVFCVAIDTNKNRRSLPFDPVAPQCISC